MELPTIVFVILAVVLVWLVVDMLVAGGGMTAGMMGGMAAMMGSGPGLVGFLLLVIIGLLLYTLL